VKLAYQHTAEHEFNAIGLKDPAGQIIVLIEARTFSPYCAARECLAVCYFGEFSMPSADFAAAKAFWNRSVLSHRGGDLPYPHLALTSDHLDIAFHSPRILDRPVLVFRDQGMHERLAKLANLRWARGAIRAWIELGQKRAPCGAGRHGAPLSRRGKLTHDRAFPAQDLFSTSARATI